MKNHSLLQLALIVFLLFSIPPVCGAGLTHTFDNSSVPGYIIEKWICTDPTVTGIGNWTTPAGVTSVDYLVVSGGASGGGGYYGGGGGGGEVLTGTLAVSGTVTVQVGKGGNVATLNNHGNDGDNSIFSSITADGGGYGGTYASRNGNSGGNGGGGSGNGNSVNSGIGGSPTGGGYTGGNTGAAAPNEYVGGGGAGAGGNGGNGGNTVSAAAGNGGPGANSSITGTPTTYGGGGGGGAYTAAPSSGGSGGGGAGATTTHAAGAGTDNLGGGGGGGAHTKTVSGRGGSGITIIKYATGTAPSAAFGNTTGFPLTGVVPLTARFTDASTGSPTSWSWDFGDGDSTNSTVQNPIHVYSTAGTYNVNLTVSNAYGSDYEYKASYVHVLAAAPVADFTGTPTALLLGNSTTFTDSSTNTPTSWLWDFGDGNHAITQNPVYLWNITGIYTVNLTASNVGGSDKKTRIDYVNVSHPLPAPTPTPTPTPGGIAGLYTRFDSNASKGEYPLAIQFYDETINASANITSYLWNFGDGSYSTDKNPLHTYSSIGVYTVSLIVNSSIGNSTYIKDRLISVTPLAVIGRYFTDDGASLLLIGVAAGMILSTTFRRREQ